MGVVGDGYDYHAGGYGHEHEHGCDDKGLEGYASLVSSARGGVFLSEGRANRAAAAAIEPAAIMYSVIMVVGAPCGVGRCLLWGWLVLVVLCVGV